MTGELRANGLIFRTDRAGPEDAALVLLLHGFPQTRYAWRHQLPALADALGARRFHLVGHDWGGQIAWWLAAQHPDRVATLSVLSRPHPAAFARAFAADAEQTARSRHHRLFQRADATERLLADDCALLLSALRDQGVAAGDAAAYLDTLSERAALDAAVNWYRAAGASGLAARACPEVAVPTLYLWGDRDATVGRAAAEATAGFVADRYRFEEIAGAGHFLSDEVPERVTECIVAHLANGE